MLDLLLPRCCVGCGARGRGWCARCRGRCAPERLGAASRLAGVDVFALGDYAGSARDAVLGYKERNRRDLAADMAAAFAAALPLLPVPEGELCLVPAPSGRRAAAARGGQHMLRVARRCAAELAAAGAPVTVAAALRLGPGVRDSVGLGPRARAANVRAHLRVPPAGLPPPGTVPVLLDDVVTTGATAAACVTALRGAGVRVAAVLALTAARGHP